MNATQDTPPQQAAPPASERRTVLRAAGLIGAITLLSRFTGLLRDIILATIFGPSRVFDVFNTAFEMPNLLRRVLGEGALSSFIVPIMSERIHGEDDRAGWHFFNQAANIMALASLALTIAGLFFSREVFLLFGGYGILKSADPGFVELGAELTRIMVPFIFCLTVGSVFMGACHTYRVFGPPSLGSVMLNLTMIATGGAALWLHLPTHPASVWIAWSVLAGAILRILLMVPPLLRAGWRWQPQLTLRDPHIRRLFLMMAPGLLAVGISQINLMVSGYFANYLDAGIKSALTMASRLIQFPMALTATATATAMLPQLAQYMIQGRHDELRDTMALTKRLEIILMIPAIMGLMVFGYPIVELLFQHGNWNSLGSKMTFSALFFYAPGLLPLGWVRLFEPVFFARHDRITPLKAAAASMLVNVALNWLLALHSPLPRLGLAPAGLAIANTIAAFVNYFVMARFLSRTLQQPLGNQPRIGETFWKSLAASTLACAGGYGFYQVAVRWGVAPHNTLTRAVTLLPAIALVATIHFALVRLLRAPDSEKVTAKILGKLRRK